MSNMKEKATFMENLTMGIQHILVAVPSIISVPLILGGALGLKTEDTTFLVAMSLLGSALAILIQGYAFKTISARLPIILGSGFAPLGAMIIIGQQYNIPTIFGAMIASAFLMFLCTFFVSKVLKFFPPIVMGCVVAITGIVFSPIAFNNLIGGDNVSLPNVGIGLFTLLAILIFSKYRNNQIRSIALLLGVVLGTLLAIPLNLVDFTPVAEASWFSGISPFYFGVPEFRIEAILIITLFGLLQMISTLGVFSSLESIFEKPIDNSVKISGMRGLAVSQLFCGLLSSSPLIMFSENTSVINVSKISARSTVAFAAFIMILISIVPKFSAIIISIPKPVIGAVTLTVLGTLISIGFSILSSLDKNNSGNTLIIGTSLAIGIGIHFAPPQAFDGVPQILSMILRNSVFMVMVVTILLNLLINPKEKSKT